MAGYLCRDQIGASTDGGLSTPQAPEPMFAWNNASVMGDSVTIVPGGGAGTAAHVQLNRDFFNAAKPDYVEYVYPLIHSYCRDRI